MTKTKGVPGRGGSPAEGGAAPQWSLPLQCELGPSRTWLRRGAVRRFALAGGAAITYALAVAAFLLLASGDSSRVVSGLRVFVVLVAVATFVGAIAGTVSGARWFGWSNHGYPPRLRLTPAGLDARYFKEHRYDLSVPWSELERVGIKRVWGTTYLCIEPKGAHRWIPNDPDLVEAVEKCMNVYGAPFVVDLTFSGVGLGELDRLLRHYSKGRIGLSTPERDASII